MIIYLTINNINCTICSDKKLEKILVKSSFPYHLILSLISTIIFIISLFGNCKAFFSSIKNIKYFFPLLVIITTHLLDYNLYISQFSKIEISLFLKSLNGKFHLNYLLTQLFYLCCYQTVTST